MPQQDIFVFYSESFWFFGCFFILYVFIFTRFIPNISFSGKFRTKKKLQHNVSILYFTSKSKFINLVFNKVCSITFSSVFSDKFLLSTFIQDSKWFSIISRFFVCGQYSLYGRLLLFLVVLYIVHCKYAGIL